MRRLLLLAVAALLSAGPASAQAPKRPHIVFVLADDLGAGDLGCYGGTKVATPNLDRLAKEGIRFAQYYSASPICSPSRAGLLTGSFPGRWKLTSYLNTRAGNREAEQADFLDPRAPSLPRLFRSVGYRTAHFGKWHLGGGRDVKDAPRFAAYGYDEHAGTWESPEPHPDITATDWIWSPKDKVKRWERTGFFVDRTLDFLRRHRESPCFVNVWLDDPHTPWAPSAEPKKKDPQGNLRLVMTELDRQIGRLLDGLEKLGIAGETLVVFASDNGPSPTFDRDRTRRLRGSKWSLYEGGVRVPCFVRWPGKTPVDRVDDATLISAVDFFPTFAALVGAPLPKGERFDGEDRTRALFGTPQPARSAPLFWEYGRNAKFLAPPMAEDRSPNLAVRDGRWSLLVNADGTGTELYDLTTDPRQRTNVADANPDVAVRLRMSVLAWRKTLP